MKRVEKKEVKEIANKIKRAISIILFITMIILIFIVSPKITNVIQNTAKYLYELDSTYITRIVELILGVTLPIAIFTAKSKK
jgi:predicted PurR-regulated permease PerM